MEHWGGPRIGVCKPTLIYHLTGFPRRVAGIRDLVKKGRWEALSHRPYAAAIRGRTLRIGYGRCRDFVEINALERTCNYTGIIYRDPSRSRYGSRRLGAAKTPRPSNFRRFGPVVAVLRNASALAQSLSPGYAPFLWGGAAFRGVIAKPRYARGIHDNATGKAAGNAAMANIPIHRRYIGAGN